MFNELNKKIAVFKPYDEEPYAPYNPRNFTGKLNSPGFRTGILSGESATREVAAFYLDCFYKNYSCVPQTTFAGCYYPNFEERCDFQS